MDFSKLTDRELRDFIGARGQTPGPNLITQAQQLYLNAGSITYPVQDLLIASQIDPALTQRAKYSLHTLESLPNATLLQFATIFKLSPETPFLRDRIIRILRFLNLIEPDTSCAAVIEKSGYIAVSELVCGRLKRENWIKILNGTGGVQCSPLGLRIATSLIRIAATRIFAEPEQSILELPVNSIDSYIEEFQLKGYNVGGTIGKFGMGFYSFIYWLIGHPTRYIHLESTYQQFNGELCSWEMIILEHQGYLVFQFSKKFPMTQTGTSITLHAEKDLLSTDNFISQLDKLKYVNMVDIQIASASAPPTAGTASSAVGRAKAAKDYNPNEKFYQLNTGPKICGKSCPVIQITISPQIIQNRDAARGISLETLFGSLLVPSISTKQIQTVTFTPSRNILTNIYPSTYGNYFIILVGTIAVVSLYVSSKEIFNHKYYNYIVQMKSSVPLPVSRDDILIERVGVAEEFLENLRRLREIALDHNLLYDLKLALAAYGKYQKLAQRLIDLFWRETRELLEAQERFFVPLEHISIFNRLEEGRFIPMDEPTSENLEAFLARKYDWDENIFFGKYVQSLPDLGIRVSTAGTSRFIFVDSRVSQTSVEWVADIAASMPNEYLLPINMTLGQRDNARIEFILKEINPEIYSAAYSLLLQTTGATTYFNIFDMDVLLRALANGLKYATQIDLDLTKDLIVLTRNFLDRIPPEDYTYGGSRPTLKRIINSKVSTSSVAPQFPIEDDRIKAVGYIRTYYRSFYPILIRDRRYYFVVPILESLDFSEFKSQTTRELLMSTARSELIQMMFAHSNTVWEYLLLKKLANGPRNVNEIALVVDYWRNRLDNTTNRELILLTTVGSDTDYQAKIERPMQTMLAVLRRNASVYRTLSPYSLSERPSQYHYTLSGLMDFAFRHPELSSDNFLDLSSKISTTQRSPLQALEIAINEGTTKEFVRAVMTETFQNALDALRSEYQTEIPPVTINVATFGENSLALTISDPVGISSAGLLALSIPFLSTKTPSEIVTGEMGSGFFNIYRESDLVRITTLKNNRRVLIEDTPIRVGGRVIDVDRKMDVSFSDSPNNGTEITMIWTPTEKYQSFAEVFYIAQNVLTLAHPVNLNGTTYQIPKTLLLEDRDFQAFTIAETEVSWILTKGVPFNEFVDYFSLTDILPKFLNDEVVTGILLNIKHGGYTPVQSRTKINMPKAQKNRLKDFSLKIVYLRLLQKYLVETREPDHFIRNSSSRTSLNQLKFTVDENTQYYDLSNFLLNYKYETGTSLAEILNLTGIYIKDQHPATMEQQIKERITAFTTDPLIAQVAWKWLQNKNQEAAFANRIQTYQQEEENLPVPPELQRFTQLFIQIFWELGGQLGIPQANFLGPAPQMVWKSLNISTLGAYVPSQHMIRLNIKLAGTFGRKIAQVTRRSLTAESILELLRSTQAVDWIGVIYPASTIVHELSHAWRRSSHEAAHQPIDLTINNQTKRYTFEEGANVVFQEIIRTGFNDRLIAAWNS